jgi:GTP-binding protein YchF
MSLSIAIVGLPNVGKSTLFNALSENKAEASNYPFCTIDPNVGIVKVPDERLEKLAEISKPKKIIPTTIEFIDIAGLVKDAHKGEGLGNQFLANIRECDAICEVIRNFEDSNIIHVHGKIDPEEDRETINMELIFADLSTLEKRLSKAEKEAKSQNKEAIKLKNLLLKIKEALENGRAARELEYSDDEKKILKSLSLLSLKPIMYIVNYKSEKDGSKLNNWDGERLFLDIKQEEEIAGLNPEEQKEFIEELGLDEPGLNKLIKSAYKLLNLITFFTTGPDESRAWTVRKGAKAPESAGVIHTDFEKGFIRAEVISYNDFIKAGAESKAREQGLVRTEGKDYLMQDGDICHFLFNR